MLSDISLSFVKADWCSVMIVGSKVFNRFANTLEKNFIQHITKANWSKLMHIFRVFNLWDEGYKCMI